ncbi:MAG: adenylate kinase [Planctomycetes bacterium]|nr:adenylate kinase [Planctomycetota bacterium]
MILVFLGPPGVGKGTQAAKLAADLHLPHISTGDLFRDHLKRKTELGRKAEGYMNEGKLVPDDLVVDLVMDRIGSADCAKGFILDGFPRTVPQDTALEKKLDLRGDKVVAAMYFDAPREVIVERISGRRTCKACGAMSHAKFAPTKQEGVCDTCGGETYQRADDDASKVTERLKEYDNKTGPLVPHYREKGILHEFDARGGVDEIFEQLKAEIEGLKA